MATSTVVGTNVRGLRGLPLIEAGSKERTSNNDFAVIVASRSVWSSRSLNRGSDLLPWSGLLPSLPSSVRLQPSELDRTSRLRTYFLGAP